MKNFLFTLVILISTHLSAQVMKYRQLPELSLSSRYKVEIKQGENNFQDIFVYQIPVNESKIITKTDHLGMVAFEPSSGDLIVRISLKDGTVLTQNNFELVNKTHSDITTSYTNGACILSIGSAKKQLLLRVKDQKAYPLQLFIDPIKERIIPTEANVVRFVANSTPYTQTAQFDRYTVPNDVDVVYIEDGALIKGTIHTDIGRSKPLILMGRGVIIGNGELVSGTAGIPYNTLEINNGSNHIIEGITVLKSRHFGLRASDNAFIDNVKMIGYKANNDGIVAGDYSKIYNCFFKVDDDNIKLYNDHMHIKNCTFYAQANGAIFQFAWNSIKPGSYCIAEDCEVIEVEFGGCGDPAEGTGGTARTFINLRETDAGTTSTDNVFRNILIQGNLIRFIGINGKYGSSNSLSIKNTLLENIEILNKPKNTSWIYTGSAPWEVSFNLKNVTIAGECIQLKEFKTEGNVILSNNNCLVDNSIMQLRQLSCMYPIPAHNRIIIDYPLCDLNSIKFYNSKGNLVLQKANLQDPEINISDLSNGIYLMVLNNQYSQKIIKQ